ncbi:MAG: EAL domain-containing protein [Acidimicrobiia bacterium]|nr:EAL domain-containing protein [Acidimicrobiia bacterium]
MAHQHHFARQPITDRDGRLLGFELLYRADCDAVGAGVVDGVFATRSVLEALDRHGLEMFDGVPVFVNLPRELVLDTSLLSFDPRRVAFEILEDVHADVAVLDAVGTLREAGFTVALDDFTADPKRLALVEHADIVKLEVHQSSRRDQRSLLRDLHARGVLVLAEKVETTTQVETCRRLGFDLFQGYAVGRPVTVALPVTPEETRAVAQISGRRSHLVPLRVTAEPVTP